jgi:small subunit ribosomal protein S13
MPVLLELPKLSPRRERIQKYGLVSMTTEYIKKTQSQQTGESARLADSFRVQTYTVPLGLPSEFALKKVYGYGRHRSKWLAAEIGIYGHYKLSKMRESQRQYIRRALNAACIAYDNPKEAGGAALRKEIGLNIQRLKDIRCYRGLRHEANLPCHGQRTSTNARTRKRMGNRVY